MTNEERAQILERHAVMLREHFSAVQIVAVRAPDDDPDGCARFSVGRGSWYERMGAMAEIVEREREKERARVAREMETDEDED